MTPTPLRRLREGTVPYYLIILALLIGIAYSLQRQTTSTVEEKKVQAGIIESGNTPALYFSLTNVEKTRIDYTYVVEYNSTDGAMKCDTSNILIPPGKTFRYSLRLERPKDCTIALNLKIFRNTEEQNDIPLHDQTWFIRP
jgi:hypothetical protein